MVSVRPFRVELNVMPESVQFKLVQKLPAAWVVYGMTRTIMQVAKETRARAGAPFHQALNSIKTMRE
jgi:hypothetical protein